MTQQEKREEAKIRIKKGLKQKVRKHRPAAKVLELETMLIEDQLERLRVRSEELSWNLEYVKNLDPAEIEPDETWLRS